MTIHAKKQEPSCNNFRFMTFDSERGDPPLVMPLMEGCQLYWDYREGVWYDFSCKNCEPNCNTFRFINFYSLRGDHPLVTPLIEGCQLFWVYREESMV